MDDALIKQLLMRSVELSIQGMEKGCGGPFGAVIASTSSGNIVSEGYNRVLESNDPTAHAEVFAIRQACQKLSDFRLSGNTLFSSCEPCPMCLSAAFWARLDAVYFANTRKQAAAIGFDDAAIYVEVALAPDQRNVLPSRHVTFPEAQSAFDIWKVREDKVEY